MSIRENELAMQKRIHITGGKGYIGSLLTNYLRAAGFTVELASYRLPDVPEKSIVADIVIHLAAAGGGTLHKPRLGHNNPDFMKKINVDGLKALLNGIAEPDTKIIFISSTAVYGKFNDAPYVDENSPLLPASEYGIQKMEAERIIKNSNFDWMIFRPCGVFGPSVGQNFGNSFLNTVVSNAISQKQVMVWGGDQWIDTVYLPDVIKIVLQSCTNEWHSKEVFNIGGEVVLIKDMLSVISDTLNAIGIQAPLAFRPYEGKPAALTDSSKLMSVYKGFTTTPLQFSMHSLVTCYLQQMQIKST